VSFASLNNRYLIVRPGVVLTRNIDAVITQLDPFFESAPTFVTSGLRTKASQLAIIVKYAELKGVAREFPAIVSATLERKISYLGQAVYEWQPAWSRLLNIGIIVNPPVPAICLFDYWRSGINRKGRLIMSSPHLRGTAFDIGGGPDGISGELAIMNAAFPKVPGIRGMVIERDNNAIHVDCVPVV
jgi:hypothetical protein